MLGLDIELIMHHLSIARCVKPVKQKLRKIHPHVAFFVKDELEKILSDKFIRAVHYVKWIFNIGDNYWLTIHIQCLEDKVMGSRLGITRPLNDPFS